MGLARARALIRHARTPGNSYSVPRSCARLSGGPSTSRNSSDSDLRRTPRREHHPDSSRAPEKARSGSSIAAFSSRWGAGRSLSDSSLRGPAIPAVWSVSPGSGVPRARSSAVTRPDGDTALPSSLASGTRASIMASDALVSEGGSGLEYDFLLAAGARPSDIRLSFPEALGVVAEPSGALRVTLHDLSSLRHAPPVAYQEIGGKRRRVAARFAVRSSGEVGFEVGAYDPTMPLVIDPTIELSTLFGGLGFASDVAADETGNVYVVGQTNGENFPVTGDLGHVAFPYPAYLFKVSPSGELLFSVLFGGQGSEEPLAVTVDPEGNAVVCGGTNSIDFPLVGAFQTQGGGSYVVGFVIKFASDGSRILFSASAADRSFRTPSGFSGRRGVVYVSGWTEGALDLVNAADSVQVGRELSFPPSIRPRTASCTRRTLGAPMTRCSRSWP